MDTKNIGNYIQTLRKQKGLSQKELAKLLSVTFQAVSKWETGDNLPDANILLDLADILDTTTDKLLSAGRLPIRRNRRINIAEIKDGISAIEKLKSAFGASSLFYRGAIEGINSRMNIDIESYLQDDIGKELLLAEAIIQYLVNGYYIDESDVVENFTSESIINQINKYRFDCSLFTSQAQNYRNYRPGYPKSAIELIFSQFNFPIIADFGSGTGKLSKLLLDKAKRLYAVEPNRQMRHYAEELLGNCSNYVSLAASAEHTPLPDSSVDIITAAESYHWFDNERAHLEMRRILKKDGYVFLLWNVFGGDDFDDEMIRLKNIYRAKKKQKPSGISYEQRAVNLFGAKNYATSKYDNSFFQTLDEFRGGMLSSSFAPDKTTEDYIDFIADIEEIFDKYSVNGKIKNTVTTICYWGKLQQEPYNK